MEQVAAFGPVAFAELFLVFSCRSPREAAWRLPGNPYLLASVAPSAVVVALAVYLPALREPLGISSLGAAEAAVVVALALVPAAVAEAGKAVRQAISGNPKTGAGTTTMDARARGGRLAA